MKINKKVKTALLSLLGFSLFMFVILVYHIATAKPLDNATIQVSRIDFDKPFDSLSTTDIKQKLHSIAGVKDEIIVKRNVVVYFHDNRITNSKKVYNELMSKGKYNAERFILPQNMVNKQVCPVMKKDGISYKFTKLIQGIF
jgi:ribosomal protein S24E